MLDPTTKLTDGYLEVADLTLEQQAEMNLTVAQWSDAELIGYHTLAANEQRRRFGGTYGMDERANSIEPHS